MRNFLQIRVKLEYEQFLFLETITASSGARGESPPGQAAQIGMGIGISFMAVILIVEIIVLKRFTGSKRPAREANYQLPAFPMQDT